jgi:hypothetical protein
MEHEKGNPGAGGAGAKKVWAELDPSLKRPTKQTYFLFVDPDGHEHHLDRELLGHSLHVTVEHGIETTRLWDQPGREYGVVHQPTPRGKGWYSPIGNRRERDGYNIWCRKAVRR